MTRLTIDITPEEKQKIKALAAVHGQTMKDYVRTRLLPDTGEVQEINALLAHALTENRYSDWTKADIEDIRQTMRD